MPIVGISGKHGTTMTARLIAWLLQISGKNRPDLRRWPVRQWPRAALDGLSDWETGERLLLNKSVEAGVFESSARMIQRRPGLRQMRGRRGDRRQRL
jgi:cyanophycin synthetase